MTCIARLTCWVAPDRADDFAEEYERHLAPCLQQRGLEAGGDDTRPTVPEAFTRLWEAPSAAHLSQVRQALTRDPRWTEALHRLEGFFGDDLPVTGPRDGPFATHLQVYSADLGPGTHAAAGAGQRQGNWLRLGVADGLDCAVVDLLEDDDGRLWLATGYTNPDGLYRLDAGRAWRLGVQDGLPHATLFALARDPAGRLWLATADGVARVAGGRIEAYGAADGLLSTRVFCAHVDADGVPWFGTRLGLYRFDGRTWSVRTTADGLACDRVGSIHEAPDGRLWLCGGRWFQPDPGLTRWDTAADRADAAWTSGALADILCLSWDGDGPAWAATSDGKIGRLVDDEFVPVHACPAGRVSDLAVDGDSLWASTSQGGVIHFDGRLWTAATTADGLANNQTFALHLDRRGLVWVGTYSGLSRHDGARLASFTAADGLASDGVMSILEDRTGRLWFGTWDGASVWDGQRLRAFDPVQGWHVWRMLEDRHGGLWFADASGQGLLHIGAAVQQRLTEADGLPDGSIRSLLEDRHGHLWLGTQFGGICRYDGEGFRVFREGIPDHQFCSLEDAAGTLWFGSSNGLCRLRSDEWKVFTTADGLPSDDIFSLLEDDDGLLVGTRAGLCRCDGEGFQPWGPEVVGNRSVMSIDRDPAGRLWLGTRGGVILSDGLVAQTFDRRDGLVFDDVQCVLHDRQGFVWIATEAGVTRYRPSAAAPGVELTAVVADRRHRPEDGMQIPVTRGVVAFEFAGRSWTTPARRIRYQCRLEGLDDTWRAVDRPRVEYEGLPEGRFTFEVRAVDLDLNASAPASVSFEAIPDVLVASLTDALRDSSPGSDFIGRSDAILRLQAQLRQVAATDLAVLIQGETGTGKGLAARFLHEYGARTGPFITVNCGAVPETLFDSELFGHERGAFTGATSRRLGKVELAAGGTLFLDEIGDMPPATQVKLLRVLQEGTFERVGGTRELSAKVRVVSATNRDLDRLIETERFRVDLYYRLEGMRVALPSLRERVDDIELLALHFVERMAHHLGRPTPGLSAKALAALRGYEWPGNVRELEHAIQRAVVLCAGDIIEARDLGLGSAGPRSPDADDGGLPLEEVERRHISRALEATGWVIKGPQGAAQRLGLSPTALRRRIAKYGLRRDPAP